MQTRSSNFSLGGAKVRRGREGKERKGKERKGKGRKGKGRKRESFLIIYK